MRSRDLGRALGVLALAAMPAACSGLQGQTSSPAMPADNAARPVDSKFGATGMVPEAKKTNLLYVSDDKGKVYIFSYPAGKPMGTLTGFNGPAGLCSDANGDVFIADTGDQNILEYAHGGKQPISTLQDFGAFPNGCSVDPTTGNLAVTNYSSNPVGPGSVAIYSGAQGSPTFYTADNFNVYLFCGYDGKGNLYIDGLNSGTTQPLLAELPSGGTSFTGIALDRSIGLLGAIQWDGKNVAVEDVSTDTVYQVSVSGSTGTVVGSTQLSSRSNLLVQFWIQGQTIVAPEGTKPRHANKVGLWPYPGGGSPTGVLSNIGSTELYGATVSLAK